MPPSLRRSANPTRKEMSSENVFPCYDDGQNGKADCVDDSSGAVKLIVHVHEVILPLIA